jgi:YD repeat-containing protein
MNIKKYFYFSILSLFFLWHTNAQEEYQNPGWQTASALNQQEVQSLVQQWQTSPPNPNTNTTLNASAFLSVNPLAETQVSASLAATAPPSSSGVSLAAVVGNEADTITPEIQALAIALDKDPVKIFEYLYNTIDYELYYGCKKGAHLTLLEGGGNDMDQAALFIALLRASGVVAQYRHGAALFPYSFLTSWWGVNSVPFSYMTDSEFSTYLGIVNTSPSDILYKRRAICAFEAARTAGFFMCEPFQDVAGNTWISIPYTRVVFTHKGTSYAISPAAKSYSSPSAVNLPSTFGYNRTNFLSSAGGTSALPDSIQNVNESNIANTLSSYTTSLITALRNTHDSKSIESLLGKRKIITRSFSLLSDALPIIEDTAATWYSANTLSAIPSDRMAKITITAGAYNYATKAFSSTLYNKEVTTPSLAGKKLSLAFSGNTASVRLGDTLLSSTFTLSASTCDIRVKASHGFFFLKYQGNSWVSDPANVNRYNSEHVTKYAKSNSNAYAFSYSFSDPAQQLRASQERLDGYTRAGITDWRATTEILNISGLRYFKQLFDATQCLETFYQVRTQNHNLVATVAQETSYYIDIGVFTSSDTQLDANQGISDAFYGMRNLFGSSMEHGVFEQSQRTNSSAVSTVRLLQAANLLGQKIYRATPLNKIEILDALTNYSTNKKTEISNLLTLSGDKALLPANGKFKLSTWDWEGGGYAAEQTDKVHMIISKTLNLNGGYSTYNNNTYSIPQAQQNLNSSPYYNQGTATGLNALTYVPNSTPKHISWDPVELSSGAFILAKTDLSLGNASAPLGLTFSRDYHTHKRYDNSAGLGYGWSHSASAYITERSAPEAAFGGADIYQAAPFLVAAAVAKDLHLNHANAKEWVTAALVVHWAMEQVRYNAVSVTIGNQALQFIKMPDGTYVSPPGQKITLTKETNNTYKLQELHGNTYQFDTNNRLSSIVDASGNTMTYNYHAVTGKIDSIVDAFTRTLTFNWTNNNISSISDSTGRTISYQYTNGDLTSYTDPEGKIHTYQYDAEHRIGTMKDPESRFMVKNFYDTQSRVTRQLSMNDTTREWTYIYSGYVNKEKNPQGGITAYYHDARGRNIGGGNALGNSNLIRYDGQDRLITTVTRNNETTDIFYNSDNNLIAQYDPLLHYDEYFYDSQKRLERINDKSGKNTFFTYTANHLVETITTETGYSTPTNVNDYVTRHTYWPNGLLKTQKDQEGKITTYDYDSWGQVNKITFHDSKFITKLNNARGDLLENTDESGNKTIFTYNKPPTSHHHTSPRAWKDRRRHHQRV